MSRLDEIKKRDAELVDYANLVPDRRYLLSMVDALQAELARSKEYIALANATVARLDRDLAAVKAERDHLQNGFNAAVATVQVRDARIAQLEAALQPFLLKPPQTHQVDILSRPQPVWWDCICGVSNSLDSCGNCCRSRSDTKRETKE